MTVQAVGVIPARYGSGRYPGKALIEIDGKPLLYHVWRQALKAKSLSRVVIATDNSTIAKTATKFGAEVIRTAVGNRNGSERTFEVSQKIPARFYVNIQGDNLRFRPSWIDQGLAELSSRRKEKFLTLFTPIKSDTELFNPDRVKATLAETADGLQALWFSRFPLPLLRQAGPGELSGQFKFYKHLGFYFYRNSGLKLYGSWSPGAYEKAESLEQLRILERGCSIGALKVRGESLVIDSPADLAESI